MMEILEDFFFIERGYLNGNHFVYRGDEPVLVDTAYSAHRDETQSLVAQLGVPAAGISLIVNTHCHCDHVGGNRYFQEMSRCDVAMHRVGCHFINTRDDWATWWRYYGQEAEFFSCTRVLDDGDELTMGPHVFRVIHTPGHSGDGIVLYHEKEKILISSDALWERDVPVLTLSIEGSRSVFDMLESLEKIRGLDVRTVYPGHGGFFHDYAGAIATAEKRLRQYLGSREAGGYDLLKKITVYTIMMKGKVPADGFFSHLMGTYWFRDTVDRYFDGRYEEKYRDVMDGFLSRGIVSERDGYYITAVKP